MTPITAVTDPGVQPLARLYRDGQAAGSVPMTETDQPGFYVADAPANLAAGTYQVLILVGPEIVASGELIWDGFAEIEAGLLTADLHLVHGLRQGSPLSVTTTSRNAGYVAQTITEDAGVVTVERV